MSLEYNGDQTLTERYLALMEEGFSRKDAFYYMAKVAANDPHSFDELHEMNQLDNELFYREIDGS